MLLKQNFVETKLVTKFAEFNIRVYENDVGKETLVLWTDNLDLSQPVLVRVHSECITGDMLGSLHCDCGEQLTKSLQLISEEGGILIYLRQEGRGIGLFEKMKSYQLQSKGYDTFEANVLLGHHPDERSYEMVKQILNDLKVSNIKLLTNNPSKVSDISKLGINIVELIPIISKPNKHNKKYLETKIKRFHHSLKKSSNYYFYQFHVDTSEHVDEIIDFLKDKNIDPLLKICVGITVNPNSLRDKCEIERVDLILNSCKKDSRFIPVVHYSFSNSFDVLSDSFEIKKKWSEIRRLQINDLIFLDVLVLKKIGDLFEIDIPLSDENFEIVYDRQFRDLVKKKNAFIMLDNSKGRGIKACKDTLMKKIDVLLSYDLNDIAICGGFGPDELDTYFEIRRYYRFNFSIDAETNLKKDGKINVDKVKIYLLQLIRFDDPKRKGIEQTKKFLMKHRHSDWNQAKIQGHEFLIHPNVFQAGCFPSTSWFSGQLCDLLKNSSSFCEVGCGSGVISCTLALSNPKLQVIATDINPYASENTKLNAERFNLSSRISVFTGDVLDGIDSTIQFDSIFWALPFGFLDPGTPITFEEVQVFDPGYRAIRKFLQTAKKHLIPGGKLFLGFCSDLGHYELLKSIAQEVHASIKIISKTEIQEDAKLQFEILELSYGESGVFPLV